MITFLTPGLTAWSLLHVVAGWAIVLGGLQIYVAIRLRREIEGEIWLGLGGILAVLFGIYLVAFPGAGLVSLAWLVSAWLVVFGISSLVLAWRLGSLAAAPAVA